MQREDKGKPVRYANDSFLTKGLDSECCGEECTSMGIPRAGLVPEPLLPANWPRGRGQAWRSVQKPDRRKNGKADFTLKPDSELELNGQNVDSL